MKCTVDLDEITVEIASMMDYEFSGVTSFTPPICAGYPKDFGIGVIVGPSGSGKSTILKAFGSNDDLTWNPSMSVASHFDSAYDAQSKLGAAGLNSVPSWLKPYHVLSTGEKFRADVARSLRDGCVIDEFTSTVDRTVARSCSTSLSKFIHASNIKNVVLATCHYDVLDWLDFDWVFDTASGQMSGRGSHRRRSINLEVIPCTYKAWPMFREHHYLDGNINKSSRCWIATWDGVPVGFGSAIAFPNGNFKNAWREHRTVILPDYQGMGFGVRLSDCIAFMFVSQGCRYFSKTSHPKMGAYREASKQWKGTSKNKTKRKDYAKQSIHSKEANHAHRHINRICFSHEYVGGTLNAASTISI